VIARFLKMSGAAGGGSADDPGAGLQLGEHTTGAVQQGPARVVAKRLRFSGSLWVRARRLQTLQIGRKVWRCATIGGKTAQISQGRHRFGRADGKGLGQHPSLDLP